MSSETQHIPTPVIGSLGFAIFIFFNGSSQIKILFITEGFLVIYRSTQPTCLPDVTESVGNTQD